MRALDLYCGAGGAAMGLKQAGFDEIVGVDVKPMPEYPFKFYEGDVLDLKPPAYSRYIAEEFMKGCANQKIEAWN